MKTKLEKGDKQTDKLEFYKDKNGEIYNNCGIMAMTSPEEIKRED